MRSSRSKLKLCGALVFTLTDVVLLGRSSAPLIRYGTPRFPGTPKKTIEVRHRIIERAGRNLIPVAPPLPALLGDLTDHAVNLRTARTWCVWVPYISSSRIGVARRPHFIRSAPTAFWPSLPKKIDAHRRGSSSIRTVSHVTASKAGGKIN